MRIRILALGAITVSLLSGCGGMQALIFRIAMDQAKLGTAAQPTCYATNQLPMMNVTSTALNLRDEAQWVLWDAEGKQYLDVGTQSYSLGDAPDVVIGQLIERDSSTDKIFQATRTTQSTQGAISTTTQANYKVTFETLGATVKGKINISSAFRCSGPNCMPSQLDCAAETDFIGRRIDGQQIVPYSPSGS